MITGLKIFLIGCMTIGFIGIVVISRKIHNRRNRVKARQWAFNRSMFID